MLAVGVKLVVTVENGNLRRAVQRRLYADSGGCAARAQYHQTLALHLDAVLVKVANEAHAVGVVAGQLAVLTDGNGVARADEPCGGGQLIQIGRHGGLAGHGDVEAAHAQGLEGLHARFGLLQRDVEGQIRGVEASALEAVIIHGGGAGVSHRGADQAKELGMSGNSAFHSVILLSVVDIVYCSSTSGHAWASTARVASKLALAAAATPAARISSLMTSTPMTAGWMPLSRSIFTKPAVSP